MAALSDYVSGLISLTNDEVEFTGTGTAWLSSGFLEGDFVFDVEGGDGRMGVIAEITGEGSGTLTRPWPGPTLTDVAYRIRYHNDGARMGAQARNLVEVVGSGNLQAIAELDGTSGNKGVLLDGAGSAATFALTAFARTLLDDADAATARATLGSNNASNLGAGTIPDARLSTTLPADKAYRRGNIRGTVSQAAGVPTGAIVERSSNANGEYVRFADGTQICTKVLTGLGPVSLAWGNIFWNNNTHNAGNWPSTFVAKPAVLLNKTGGSSSVATGSSTVAPSTTAAGTIVMLAGTAQAATDLEITVVGIGRWF